MMIESFQNGLVYLIRTVFNLFLFVMIIRFILAWVRADYFNPLTQITVRLTNPLVKPVRKILHNYRDIELSSLVLIYLINTIKFMLIAVMSSGMPAILGLLALSFADMLDLFIQVMMGALFLYVILSWIQPFSPVQRVLSQVVSPIVTPFQRILPPIAGFDLSIIPAFMVLQLTSIMLINPLYHWAATLTV